MSEKSICRRVRGTLPTARPPRADDTDRFGIVRSPQGVHNHQDATVRSLTESSNAGLLCRVLQIRAIQPVRVEEDRPGVGKTYTVFLRVGLSLPRIPFEHLIEYIRNWIPDGPLGSVSSRVPFRVPSCRHSSPMPENGR